MLYLLNPSEIKDGLNLQHRLRAKTLGNEKLGLYGDLAWSLCLLLFVWSPKRAESP